MIDRTSEVLHATTVAIGGRGVLIEGASGLGKSDLALRLIDRGAMLIADDRTIVRRDGAALFASCPATIAGRMEVRGVGIVATPHIDGALVALVVTLSERVERMPGASERRILGVAAPAVLLGSRDVSAALKVEIALRERGLPAT